MIIISKFTRYFRYKIPTFFNSPVGSFQNKYHSNNAMLSLLAKFASRTFPLVYDFHTLWSHAVNKYTFTYFLQLHNFSSLLLFLRLRFLLIIIFPLHLPHSFFFFTFPPLVSQSTVVFNFLNDFSPFVLLFRNLLQPVTTLPKPSEKAN